MKMVVGKAFFTIDTLFYNPVKCECVGYLIQPALPAAKNYNYTTAHTTKLTFFILISVSFFHFSIGCCQRPEKFAEMKHASTTLEAM